MGVALNPEQERAAAAIDGPVMVLAGAGSGKTRVITARLARMLAAGVDPRAIVALTFTNKAAAEMRERAGISRRGRRTSPTVCTFHALGLQLVRGFSAELGFRSASAGAGAAPVTVYDQQDSAQLLREVARDLRLDADLAEADPALLQRLVSGLRMGGAGAPDLDGASEQLRGLVSAYRRRLRLYHAVDFDDLILLPLELLRGESGDAIRARFSHVMVDEFQDTSRRQYQILHTLTEAARNVCVVGDDDQSIYSWRGAEAANFDHFSRDFPRTPGNQAGTELPLHRLHPGIRQRRNQRQQRPAAQEAVERRRRRDARHGGLPGERRRRGGVDRASDPQPWRWAAACATPTARCWCAPTA